VRALASGEKVRKFLSYAFSIENPGISWRIENISLILPTEIVKKG
jgi:hypothetical protein